VRRLPEAVERLVALYRAERMAGEALAPFFERLPLDRVRTHLRDLEVGSAVDVSADDFVDLEEAQAFAPEVLDGECSA
jgi:sulfite reductase (NADPH) hemoprotein beta-component